MPITNPCLALLKSLFMLTVYYLDLQRLPTVSKLLSLKFSYSAQLKLKINLKMAFHSQGTRDWKVFTSSRLLTSTSKSSMKTLKLLTIRFIWSTKWLVRTSTAMTTTWHLLCLWRWLRISRQTSYWLTHILSSKGFCLWHSNLGVTSQLRPEKLLKEQWNNLIQITKTCLSDRCTTRNQKDAAGRAILQFSWSYSSQSHFCCKTGRK